MPKKATLITLGSILAVVAIALYVSSVYNDSVSREKHILALDEQNRNNLSNFTLRVQEMAQVPDMQVDGPKQVVSAAMQGRYGQNGSKAVFQWIQEQNLQLDQSTYKKLMLTMETGRKDFEAEQKKKIDACREYNTLLDKFPRGPVTDGNIRKSLEINTERFGMNEQLVKILENTIPDLDRWLEGR